jgi:hypothetical protein
MLYTINGYYSSSTECGFICNISILYVKPSLLWYKIFIILCIVLVYMYCMTTTYFTSCSHPTNFGSHEM